MVRADVPEASYCPTSLMPDGTTGHAGAVGRITRQIEVPIYPSTYSQGRGGEERSQ